MDGQHTQVNVAVEHKCTWLTEIETKSVLASGGACRGERSCSHECKRRGELSLFYLLWNDRQCKNYRKVGQTSTETFEKAKHVNLLKAENLWVKPTEPQGSSIQRLFVALFPFPQNHFLYTFPLSLFNEFLALYFIKFNLQIMQIMLTTPTIKLMLIVLILLIILLCWFSLGFCWLSCWASCWPQWPQWPCQVASWLSLWLCEIFLRITFTFSLSPFFEFLSLFYHVELADCADHADHVEDDNHSGLAKLNPASLCGFVRYHFINTFSFSPLLYHTDFADHPHNVAWPSCILTLFVALCALPSH